MEVDILKHKFKLQKQHEIVQRTPEASLQKFCLYILKAGELDTRVRQIRTGVHQKGVEIFILEQQWSDVPYFKHKREFLEEAFWGDAEHKIDYSQLSQR